MAGGARLPAEFSDFERFADEWMLTNERDRLAKLVASSIADLRVFYEAVAPRAEAMHAHLERFDVAALPEAERNLFHLLMTFVECAHPIELGWTVTDIDQPFPLERLRFAGPSATSPVERDS